MTLLVKRATAEIDIDIDQELASPLSCGPQELQASL